MHDHRLSSKSKRLYSVSNNRQGSKPGRQDDQQTNPRGEGRISKTRKQADRQNKCWKARNKHSRHLAEDKWRWTSI